MPTSAADPADRTHRLLLAAPNRRRVFEAISRRPGTHVRRLSRELRMALGSVEHHLHQLEKHDLVFSHSEGRRRTFYASGAFDPVDAGALHALSKPLWADILRCLALREDCSVSYVAGHCGIPVANASYHLRRLRRAGLVDQQRIGRRRLYFARDPERIIRLMPWALPDTEDARPADPCFTAIVRRAGILEPPPAEAVADPPGPARSVAAQRR